MPTVPSTETLCAQFLHQSLPIPPGQRLPHGELSGVVRSSQWGQEVEGWEEKLATQGETKEQGNGLAKASGR